MRSEFPFTYLTLIFFFVHVLILIYLSLIFRAGINHFYVVHENGGLFACSKGRPTKELTKQRLDCPEKIEEELAGLRKDFLLNDKCKMLVLVSMATDGMIHFCLMEHLRLISMKQNLLKQIIIASQLGSGTKGKQH